MAKLGWRASFLRWLSNLLWPGKYDSDYAKTAYKSYISSEEVESLSAAIEHFELAVEQYRKRQNPSLAINLINYAVAVWRHYKDISNSTDDLDKVVRLDIEALASWTGETNVKSYVILLETLARAYFEQYQKAVGSNPVNPNGRQEAFDNAVKHYTALKDNTAAASQRRATQIQLGVMFRMRSETERTLDQFDVGIKHLKEALSEATKARNEVDTSDESDEEKREKQATIDVLKADCHLNLADSYEVRYVLVNDPRKTHDLTMAIESNTEAKSLLEDLESPELPVCLFNLGRQHWLRWTQSRDQSDYDTAKQMAEAVRGAKDADEQLKQRVDELVGALRESQSRQGTLDSIDMNFGGLSRRATMLESSDGGRGPKHQSTILVAEPQSME